MRFVRRTSSGVNFSRRPKKGGINMVACLGSNNSCTVKPLSTKIKSPGLIKSKIPDFLKIETSLILPSNKSDMKQAPPLGVTAIKHFHRAMLFVTGISVPLPSVIPWPLTIKLCPVNNKSNVLECFQSRRVGCL